MSDGLFPPFPDAPPYQAASAITRANHSPIPGYGSIGSIITCGLIGAGFNARNREEKTTARGSFADGSLNWSRIEGCE
jgi:hypothetical protein